MSHDESSSTCACGGNCGCNTSQESGKVYLTQEEYIGKLEHYLVDLKAEIESVEQELMELKSPAEMVAA
jgi:hypothetical protein